MEYNRDRNASGKIHRNRESYNIPFNVNNNWQEDSSQSHQHHGITLYNQQEHTKCRILRSHSGAIQIYQTRRVYWNPTVHIGSKQVFSIVHQCIRFFCASLAYKNLHLPAETEEF